MYAPPLLHIIAIEIKQNTQAAEQQHQSGNIPIPAVADPIEIRTYLHNRAPGIAKGGNDRQL